MSALHPTDQLLDFAYQELDAERAREIELHVQTCDACARELAQIRGVRKTMSQLAPETAPPGGLESLLAYAEQSARRTREGSPRRWRLAPWWMVPAGTAATLVLLAVIARPMFSRSTEALVGQASPLAYDTRKMEAKQVQAVAPSAPSMQAKVSEEKAAAPVAGAERTVRRPAHRMRTQASASAAAFADRAEASKKSSSGAAFADRAVASKEAKSEAAFADRATASKTSKSEAADATAQGLLAANEGGGRLAGGASGMDRFDAAPAAKAPLVTMAPSAPEEEAGAPAPSVAQPPTWSAPSPKPSRSRAAAALPSAPAGSAASAANEAAPMAARAEPMDPREVELAQLEHRLPRLTGPSRAQALERVCGLQLSLGRRADAEQTFRALAAEFPDAAETARTRARLASEGSPSGE